MLQEPFKIVITQLPILIITALAIIMFLAWLIKTLNEDTTYGKTLKNKWFLSISSIIILATVCYYFYTYIIDSQPKFDTQTLGILIAKFKDDENNITQRNAIELLKYEFKKRNINVHILPYKNPINDENKAKEILSTHQGDMLIWGTFIREDCIHYKFTTPNKDLIITKETDFPNIKCLESIILTTKKIPPIVVQNLEKKYTRLIYELEHKIQNLEKRINAIETKNSSKLIDDQKTHYTAFEKVYSLSVAPLGDYIQFDQDAINFNKAVEELYPNAITELIINEDATKENVIKSFEQLSKKITTNDLVLIYFSGHGGYSSKETNNQGFVILANYEINSNDRFNSSDFKYYLNKINSKLNILFIDACFAGNISPYKNLIHTENKSNYNIVFSSSLKNQYSWSTQKLGGLFSQSLFRGLSGEADLNDDEDISINELFLFTKQATALEGLSINRTQTPTISGTYKNFILKRKYINSTDK